MNQLIEYMKLHIISLEQDLEAIGFATDELTNLKYHHVLGQVEATRHLLSVAEDILG
jgi:hypothetical protein